MRTFFGILVGICLTIGTAYVADAMRSAPDANGVAAQPMVNWEVVDKNMQTLSTTVKTAWARLTSGGRDV
jgi:hypothetical protein